MIKNIKKNGIILALITFLVLFLVLKNDFQNIVNLLTGADFVFILLACFLEAGVIFFESSAFHQVLKSYDNTYPFKKTLELNLISKFFNGITPFSTGGQPMQVYYLSKDGFRLTKATNAIMQNFILYQTALITVGIISILLNYHYNYFNQVPLLRKLVTLGFLINTLVMVFLFVISFSDKFNRFIIKKGLKITTKLRRTKDKEARERKWLERCSDFHEGATYIKENKGLCLIGYLYNVLALILFYVIPFFVAKALDIEASLLLIPAIVATSYVAIIGSFVPIPGASGGIEYGFLAFFGNFITGSLLSATLLIWRALTYYIPMVVGAITLNIRKDEKK